MVLFKDGVHHLARWTSFSKAVDNNNLVVLDSRPELISAILP